MMTWLKGFFSSSADESMTRATMFAFMLAGAGLGATACVVLAAVAYRIVRFGTSPDSSANLLAAATVIGACAGGAWGAARERSTKPPEPPKGDA